MESDNKSINVKVFDKEELEKLKKDPNICNHGRRSFLKWSAIVSSQAVIGGGLVSLIASKEARADDNFDNVTEWVYSVCGYCSFGCGINIGVNAEGKAVAVRGNEKHPTNNGRVCVKGLFEDKILEAPDRGKWPLVRDASGNWKKITWDEATTILSQKIIDGVDAKGADSIATYNTGQWTLEE